MSDIPCEDVQPGHAEVDAAERRVSSRAQCDWVTFCSPCLAVSSRSSDRCWEAQAQDVSEGGILIDAQRRFEPGTLLFIGVPDRAADEPRRMLATVVHVRSATGGAWSLGCRFVSPLDKEDVDDLALLELPHFND